MKIKESSAGTDKNNDVLVTIYPHDSGRVIELTSLVKDQFEDEIMQVVNSVLDEYNIDNIKVVLMDKGALNYTYRARVKTAILRGLI